jgi:hypothetical protein
MEKPKYYCEKCDFSAAKLCYWKEHILTKKHTKQDSPAEDFNCKLCDVKCSHRSTFDRHNKTKKHLEAVKNSGLTETKYLDIITQLLLDHQRTSNDNNELKNFIIEQSKTLEKVMETNTEIVNKALSITKPNTTTINTTNNQTNKFNINVFLNETCKNAINFSDFINNIQITYEDLENNARLGFVNGISKIFLDNLNQLDISERPIHCTDVKRETMYIKDDNTWTKQTSDEKLQKAIQGVSYKSMGKLGKWKQENPDYNDADSEFSQRCLIMQKNTLAGSERGVYYPKVIHVLARESAIEK